MKKLPVISRADYNTILLHAEKISNGQHDFIHVLHRELREKLKIADAESLLSDLVRNKDVEFLNRVRVFLSQFPFVSWICSNNLSSLSSMIHLRGSRKKEKWK